MTNELFRFVSITKPQSGNRGAAYIEDVQPFLASDGNDRSASLAARIEGAENAEAAERIAAGALAETPPSAVSKLALFWREAQGMDVPAIEKLVKTILGKTPNELVAEPGFNASVEWASNVAVARRFTNAPDPVDGSELADILRGANLVRGVARGDSDVDRILRAPALIPRVKIDLEATRQIAAEPGASASPAPSPRRPAAARSIRELRRRDATIRAGTSLDRSSGPSETAMTRPRTGPSGTTMTRPPGNGPSGTTLTRPPGSGPSGTTLTRPGGIRTRRRPVLTVGQLVEILLRRIHQNKNGETPGLGDISAHIKSALTTAGVHWEGTTIEDAVNTLERKLDVSAATDDRIGSMASSQTGNNSSFDPKHLAGTNNVRILGVGELNVVSQEPDRYEPGDISHIENVMESETRARAHRSSEVHEEMRLERGEREETIRNHLETTNRAELQSRSQRVLATELEVNAGMAMTAKYGPLVEISANADVSARRSMQESREKSSTLSRSITEKAEAALVTREITETRSTTRTESEERNEHSFVNTGDEAKHVRGVYRWVDQILTAKQHNHGARLFLEFVMPEPAANLVHQLRSRGANGVSTPEPGPFDIEVTDIEHENYLTLAARYGCTDIEPPPLRFTVVSKTIIEKPPAPAEDEANDEPTGPSSAATAKEFLIEIPAGYAALRATTTVIWGRPSGPKPRPASEDQPRGGGLRALSDLWLEQVARIVVGQRFRRFYSHEVGIGRLRKYSNLDGETGQLPVVFTAVYGLGVAATVEIVCERTEDAYRRWQIETFEKLRGSHQSQVNEHASAIRNAAAMQAALGRAHPDELRSNERRELRRGVLTMLTGQHFDQFGALDFDEDGRPRIDLDDISIQGPVIRFFERILEWDQMTYRFYPYFWSGRDRWLETASQNGGDLLHQEFLQAGAARIVVPVTPENEAAVIRYLDEGEITEDGEYVDLALVSEEFASVVALIDGMSTAIDPPIFIDSWEVRVPTRLVHLQESGDLNP
jgi:hypothetical protein